MTQIGIPWPCFDIFGRSGMPKPAPRRQLGQTVLGPDPRTITASLLPDQAPPILGRLDAGNHFLFTVPGSVTGGFHTRAEAFGYQPYLVRLRDSAGQDIPIETLDGVELPLVQMVAEAVPPVVVARTGLVRADGKAIRDDAGLFHGRGATWFWMLQAWMADGAERDRLKRNADWWDASHRHPDFFRILCEVGTSGNPDSSWAGLEIDWTQPKWKSKGQETLAQVLDFFYKEHGVRLELTILGKGSATDPVWLAGIVGDVVADGRQHMVMDIEMVNESGSGTKVSIATMKQMATVLKAKVPNILALSSPMETSGAWDEMEAAALALNLKGFSVHQRRKMLDKGWGYVRQGYDAKNTDLVAFYNENKGHGDSSGGLTDPLLLAMAAAVAATCGAATIVAHTGTGVYGNGKSHPVGGARPANFFEIPDYDAQLAAQWRVLDLIPVGVQNWSVKNTQNAGVPFDLPKSMHQGTGYEDSSGFGVNKAYAAVSPSGAFIQLPCGVKMAGDKPCQMDVMFSMKEVTVYDPLTREPIVGLENLSLTKGDKLPVPARADGMTASIIRGQNA